MNVKLSRRSEPDFQSEFLAGILAANASPNVVTFAGGNPNAESFPVEAMNAAADAVLKENGVMALQYSGTQGYLPLRQYIAQRYRQMDLTVDPSEIIITNGSQQALDLFSSVMLDPGDAVLVENPTYLAALQTFHLYHPEVVPVDLKEDGVDVEQLEKLIREKKPQFMYLIPNFQNPTGLSYTEEVRRKAAEVFRASDVIVLEDDPYGKLRFAGEEAVLENTDYGGIYNCCLTRLSDGAVLVDLERKTYTKTAAAPDRSRICIYGYYWTPTVMLASDPDTLVAKARLRLKEAGDA